MSLCVCVCPSVCKSSVQSVAAQYVTLLNILGMEISGAYTHTLTAVKMVDLELVI